jgi:membrane-associated phospholipid phosphatase
VTLLATLLAITISRLGDGWVYAATGIYLALLTPRPTVALLTMAVAVSFAMGFALATKPLVARPRPEEAPVTRLLHIDRHSFPSGHTFTAAAFTVATGWYYPHALAALVPYTLLMAWSRVHLKAHYWSDVIAAGIWGLMVGYGAVMLVRWLV